MPAILTGLAMSPELSEDELLILSLAAEGESMMALGRWEKPVERLVAFGYLRAADQFNHFITTTGKARWVAEEAAEMQVIVEWNNELFVKRQEEQDDAGPDAERLQ
jgi:hypothetical protein